MKQPETENLPDWDEMMQRYLAKLPLEERLAGIAPEEMLASLTLEQRLAGLTPEQRLAGLTLEQRLAGLATEKQMAVLRVLREDDISSLPAEAQEEIRKRRH